MTAPAGLTPAELVALDPRDRARLFADALTRATTTEQVAVIAQAAQLDRWLASPVHLAVRATEHLGAPYRAYRWITYLNAALLDLAARRTTFLIIEAPVRHGKEIRVSEDVFTTEGWRKASDLRPGDHVFGPDGHPTRIVAVSPVNVAAPKLTVRTTDGAAIDVHPNHEWTVYDRAGATRGWRTMETAAIARRALMSGTGPSRRCVFQLPVREPLVMPDADLPVPPYLFGVWLGDGTTGEPAVNLDPKDADSIISACETAPDWAYTHPETGVPRYRWNRWLNPALKAIGALNRKHIPDRYILASIPQRRALLQGLVDTDGHVEPGSGRVRYVSHNPDLAHDVKTLARTLGHRATVYTEVDDRPPHDITFASGRVHTIATAGTRYVASWTPHDGLPQGRLARKTVIRHRKPDRPGITAVEPAEPGDGLCIQVDRPDGLFLVGRDLTPTHNSQLGSVWFPTWWLLTFPDDGVLLGAYNQTLARRFSRMARNNVERFAPEFLGVGLDGSNRSYDDWRLAHPYTGGLRATGVGNPPTGMGGQLIVVDDPIKSRAEAYSTTYQENLWEWWRFNMRTRLEPGGVVVIIMSRWHERDLVGRLLAQQASGALTDDDGNPVDRYTVLRLPALAEPGDPLGRAPGEALEPARYSTSYLTGLRQEIGVYAFDALYQGTPRSADGDLFPRTQWKYASAVPAGLRWYRAWDLAATEGGGDWTVGVRIARDAATGRGWIDDVQRFRFGPGETRARIIATAAMDLHERDVRHIVIPQDPGQAGKAQLADQSALWFSDLPVRVIPASTSGSKLVRATPYAGVQAMGNIVLVVGPWVEEWVAEHAQFPTGPHDDQIDAGATGWNQAAGLNGNRLARLAGTR